MRSTHEQEFAEFFDSGSSRLLSAAWMLTGDGHVAEELVQEAMARTYARWSRVRRGNPAAYTRRTIVNLHTDRWRKRRREVLTDAVPERATSDDPMSVDLVRALARLPRRERECVVLRHYLDLSEAETARTLGVGVGSVKKYAMNGRRALRELLEGVESHD